jgi:hypothetical protein
MKTMSKAAMKRLLRSEFFHNVEELVKAWDYYLGNNRKHAEQYRKEADEMMHKWDMAKLALEYITGNIYGFSRDGTGNYGIVNERDYSDRIIVGHNDLP